MGSFGWKLDMVTCRKIIYEISIHINRTFEAGEPNLF